MGPRNAAPQYLFDGRGCKTEIRSIPGFHGYRVTENGDVYSMSRYHGGMLKMTPHVNDDGYLQIEICLLGNRKSVRVHRLVALAFLGEPPADKPETRHLDGNQLNNHYTNLEFGSHLQNMEDRARHGRNPKGTRNGRAKVDETDVGEIRKLLAVGISQSAVAKTYDLTGSTVGDIDSGKLWPDVQPASEVRHARLIAVREHASKYGKGISWERKKRMTEALAKLAAGNGGAQ